MGISEQRRRNTRMALADPLHPQGIFPSFQGPQPRHWPFVLPMGLSVLLSPSCTHSLLPYSIG